MASQQDIALQMIAQLRLLDPSASAEVGTPERKILDTVAQTVFDSQIDLEALSAQLDVDSKYGAGLDRFLGHGLVAPHLENCVTNVCRVVVGDRETLGAETGVLPASVAALGVRAAELCSVGRIRNQHRGLSPTTNRSAVPVVQLHELVFVEKAHAATS